MAKSTLEVGQRLVELCRQNKFVDAVNELYATKIASIEAHTSGPMPAKIEGIEAVRRKSEWWMNAHEIHGGTTDGPWPHGDRFIVRFSFDVTPKEGPMKGQRMQMEEAGLYTVKEGKIVQEEFFYHM